LSRGAVRYLGLKSQTLASETAKGPVTAVVDGQRDQDVYFLTIPAAVGRRIKSKHVVAMSVSVTGSATYQTAECNAGNSGNSGNSGCVPGPVMNHTETISDTGANQDAFGQGTRYGCFPIGQGNLAGGGDLVIGYLKYGQRCPKHP
jgi:hypothetical protein